jgi:hypothetical protein
MEKEKLESLIIDYIDGKLNEQDKAVIERELAANEDAYRLYKQTREVIQAIDKSAQLEPSMKLKSGFDKLLKAEMEQQKPVTAKTIFFSPMIFRAAAAIALVLSGVALGFWINKNQQRESELVKMKEQMDQMRSLMLTQLENKESASQRMIAVSQVVEMEMKKPDDEIVEALVKAMNEDSNTNVRLAAMDALSKFHQEPRVRKELIKSLGKQKDPVVQIALIQLLVKMKEKGVLHDLKKIVDDNGSMKAVKDEAYSGLMKLS